MIRKKLIPRAQDSEGKPEDESANNNVIQHKNDSEGMQYESESNQQQQIQQQQMQPQQQFENDAGVNNNSNINQPEDKKFPGPSEGEHVAKDKKKVRCKKWPMCKNEECEYAHPKEAVSI